MGASAARWLQFEVTRACGTEHYQWHRLHLLQFVFSSYRFLFFYSQGLR